MGEGKPNNHRCKKLHPPPNQFDDKSSNNNKMTLLLIVHVQWCPNASPHVSSTPSGSESSVPGAPKKDKVDAEIADMKTGLGPCRNRRIRALPRPSPIVWP